MKNNAHGTLCLLAMGWSQWCAKSKMTQSDLLSCLSPFSCSQAVPCRLLGELDEGGDVAEGEPSTMGTPQHEEHDGGCEQGKGRRRVRTEERNGGGHEQGEGRRCRVSSTTTAMTLTGTVNSYNGRFFDAKFLHFNLLMICIQNMILLMVRI